MWSSMRWCLSTETPRIFLTHPARSSNKPTCQECAGPPAISFCRRPSNWPLHFQFIWNTFARATTMMPVTILKVHTINILYKYICIMYYYYIRYMYYVLCPWYIWYTGHSIYIYDIQDTRHKQKVGFLWCFSDAFAHTLCMCCLVGDEFRYKSSTVLFHRTPDTYRMKIWAIQPVYSAA